MTRGVKIITSLWAFIFIIALTLLCVPHINLALDVAANIATVIGVAIALGALIIALFEYYSKKVRNAEENKPHVVVTVEPSKVAFTMFDIVIQNYGKTVAENISIKFTPDQLLPPYRDKISDLKILKNFKILPPGERFRFYFGQSKVNDNQPIDRSIGQEYVIDVSYRDLAGKTYSHKYYADPRDYYPLSGLAGIKTLGDVVKELAAISKNIKSDVASSDL